MWICFQGLRDVCCEVLGVSGLIVCVCLGLAVCVCGWVGMIGYLGLGVRMTYGLKALVLIKSQASSVVRVSRVALLPPQP